jgi:hypothetical protein
MHFSQGYTKRINIEWFPFGSNNNNNNNKRDMMVHLVAQPFALRVEDTCGGHIPLFCSLLQGGMLPKDFMRPLAGPPGASIVLQKGDCPLAKDNLLQPRAGKLGKQRQHKQTVSQQWRSRHDVLADDVGGLGRPPPTRAGPPPIIFLHPFWRKHQPTTLIHLIKTTAEQEEEEEEEEEGRGGGGGGGWEEKSTHERGPPVA